jgi:hypothetical protein
MDAAQNHLSAKEASCSRKWAFQSGGVVALAQRQCGAYRGDGQLLLNRKRQVHQPFDAAFWGLAAWRQVDKAKVKKFTSLPYEILTGIHLDPSVMTANASRHLVVAVSWPNMSVGARKSSYFGRHH